MPILGTRGMISVVIVIVVEYWGSFWNWWALNVGQNDDEEYRALYNG